MSTELAVVPRPVRGAQSLWSGGGSVGTASRRRRLRYRVRTLAAEHPEPYLRFARRKYPGPSPRVIGPDTEAVIDGYTRSASTFAVYAFQVAQPAPVRLAHHLHAPAQLMAAARRGLPTLMVVREPHGALLSQLVREPDVDLLDALYAYRRFHRSLLPYRDAFVVADFREVTADFGAVVQRMNDKFGTSFGVFGGTPEEHELCTALIGQRPTLSPVLLGFESGEVTLAEARAHLSRSADPTRGDATWIPSPERDAAKADLERLWASPRMAVARGRAVECYRQFTDGATRWSPGG
jgi:hypothetical protein